MASIALPPSAHIASYGHSGHRHSKDLDRWNTNIGTARNENGTRYSLQPVPISHQPAPAKQMSLNSSGKGDDGEQTVDGPMRLRGGCIPCPVSNLWLPYATYTETNLAIRMVLVATSFLFLAVARRSS